MASVPRESPGGRKGGGLRGAGRVKSGSWGPESLRTIQKPTTTPQRPFPRVCSDVLEGTLNWPLAGVEPEHIQNIPGPSLPPLMPHPSWGAFCSGWEWTQGSRPREMEAVLSDAPMPVPTLPGGLLGCRHSPQGVHLEAVAAPPSPTPSCLCLLPSVWGRFSVQNPLPLWRGPLPTCARRIQVFLGLAGTRPLVTPSVLPWVMPWPEGIP